MRLIRFLMLGLAATLVVVAGCSEETTAPPPEETSELDAHFKLTVDGAPVQRFSLIYTNDAGTKYSIEELKFIVSDVKLHNDEGGTVLLKSVHYFDIGDPGTQSFHAEDLPHANYTSVSFTFGLDASKNVRDRYPAIPAIMVWPTGLGPDLGYHYMQIEGDFELTPGDGGAGGYTTHTGGRPLDGTNPTYPNVVDNPAKHFHFPINAPFTPAHIHEGGHGELEITFNLNGWYLDHTPADGVDTQYDFKTLPSQMIMGDLDAQGKLQVNGPGCFSATLVAHGGHDGH